MTAIEYNGKRKRLFFIHPPQTLLVSPTYGHSYTYRQKKDGEQNLLSV